MPSQGAAHLCAKKARLNRWRCALSPTGERGIKETTPEAQPPTTCPSPMSEIVMRPIAHGVKSKNPKKSDRRAFFHARRFSNGAIHCALHFSAPRHPAPAQPHARHRCLRSPRLLPCAQIQQRRNQLRPTFHHPNATHHRRRTPVTDVRDRASPYRRARESRNPAKM